MKRMMASPRTLLALKQTFGNRAYMALIRRFAPNEHLRLHAIEQAAQAARVPTIAMGDVLYHHPDRRRLQDVVSCIREGCTIDEAGYRLERHADRYLKDPVEMERLFERHPEAFRRVREILDRCTFSLDELRYQYPSETEPGETAQEKLERLTWEGARSATRTASPMWSRQTCRHELHLIEEPGLRAVLPHRPCHREFARGAASCARDAARRRTPRSASCSASPRSIPTEHDLLFERFISQERREPPDIDVDFEHERREEVIQWIYDTYGRHTGGADGRVICYRARGAVREVGKALGVPEDVTAGLSGLVWGWGNDGVTEKEAKELNLNLDDPRLRMTLELARELIGAPRHLSQHPAASC